jgi:UDP-glucose/iron transport system permease protein
MAGMMVSGASPIYAAIYQFVVVAMILAASGITSLVATVLMRSRVFTSARNWHFVPPKRRVLPALQRSQPGPQVTEASH